MAITVTATQGGATGNGTAIRVKNLGNAVLAVTPATGNSGTAPQAAITTTVTGSVVYAAILGGTNTSLTAAPGTATLYDNIADAVNNWRYGASHTAVTGTPGATTVGSSTPASGNCALLEILSSGGAITELDNGTIQASTTGATTITSPSFTPAPGSLLVAMVVSGGSGAVTMAVSDTSGLIWTQQSSNGSGAYAGVWTATVPAAAVSMPFKAAPGWHPGSGLPGQPAGTPFLAPVSATPVLPPPVPVTGTGSLALVKPSLAGTGAVAAAATGSLALPKPSLSGAGAQEVTGTGSLALPKLKLPGTGAVAATGTGTLALPKLKLSGTGALVAVFDALPATPTYPLPLLDTRVELNLAGTWTDITDHVYQRDPVTITRGHPDESTTTAPSSAKLTINNRDGRFSDLNPVGPYYGSIGQNTPLRISVPEGASYLRSEVDQASYAECPDTAGISITGDMELQLDMSLGNWNGSQLLAAKWAGSGQASWLLLLWNDGTLQFQWSQDGTSINAARTSASITPPPLRRMSLRITLAVATGTVTYYTGPPGLSSPSWTLLQSVVVGANSVFDSTATLQLGYGPSSGTGFPGIAGKIHAAKLLSGIAGTAKASPDFTAQSPGATSFSDAQGNAWALNGTAEISNRKYRFHGETSAWPQAWDSTGTDVWVQITASGILRRLGQNAGGQAFQSALRRAYTRLSGSLAPVAYWPGEDGTQATQLASGLGGPPMQIAGAPSLASDSGFLCSQPIPVLNNSTWAGTVPPYTGGTDNVMRFLMHVPAGGDVNGAVIARMFTTGPVVRVDLVYGTGGTLALNGYNSAGGSLFATGGVAFAVNGLLLRVSAELQVSGADIKYNIATLVPGAGGASVFTGTLVSTAIGNVTQAVINPGGLLASTSAGQISVQPVWDTLFDLAGALSAWQGETAGVRFKRLCGEESITFRGQGNLADTVAMGPQAASALTALLQECVDADRGSVTEPRQAGPGLGYRTRGSLLNQSPAVTLSYTAAHLSDDLAPTRDDQQLQNDVTVSGAGSSSEQVLAAGPLSIQQPPNGAGRYAASPTINVATASQLDSQAAWMVWMGTVNQPRYPLVNVNLARSAAAAHYWDLQDLDLGDYLQVTDTPVWLPPGGISQLVQGVTEVVYGYVFHEAWACIPQSPWNVLIWNDLVWGRWTTAGATLHANISAGATSMLVDSPNSLWTTSGGDFPLDLLLAGERVTVTNITGASSPQTFTITRAVNGVSKAQTAGAAVDLYNPPIWSL